MAASEELTRLRRKALMEKRMEILDKWCVSLGLHPIIGKKAFDIFSDMMRPGWSEADTLAASLYMAMRTDSLCPAIPLMDFCIKTDTRRKAMIRRYKTMMFETNSKPEACSIRPGPYLDMILMKIKADDDVKTIASKILNELDESFSGRPPTAIAAATAYAAIQKAGKVNSKTAVISQKDIGDAIFFSMKEDGLQRYGAWYTCNDTGNHDCIKRNLETSPFVLVAESRFNRVRGCL